jgi:hypothetical protein
MDCAGGGQVFRADVRLESLAYFKRVRLESLTYFKNVRLESLTYDGATSAVPLSTHFNRTPVESAGKGCLAGVAYLRFRFGWGRGLGF